MHGAKKKKWGDTLRPGRTQGRNVLGTVTVSTYEGRFRSKKNDVRVQCFSYQSLARCCSVNH